MEANNVFLFSVFFSNHMNYRKSKKNQYATDKWGRMQINFQAKKYLEEKELYPQNFQRKAIWNIGISVNGLNFSTFEQKTTLSSLKHQNQFKVSPLALLLLPFTT